LARRFALPRGHCGSAEVWLENDWSKNEPGFTAQSGQL
jgi:hypothetical protein